MKNKIKEKWKKINKEMNEQTKKKSVFMFTGDGEM